METELPPPIKKDTDVYDRILTRETFPLFMNALVNLPFKRTDEDTEANMLTVVHKDKRDTYATQIYRHMDQEMGFDFRGTWVEDPRKCMISEKFLNGNYIGELTYGAHFVDPMNYQ